jgi:hypothetical protein
LGVHPFVKASNIFHVVDELYSIPVGFAVPLIVSTGISERRCANVS